MSLTGHGMITIACTARIWRGSLLLVLEFRVTVSSDGPTINLSRWVVSGERYTLSFLRRGTREHR